MICCGSKVVDQEQRTKSEQIDHLIRQDRSRLNKKVKILLLGTGESGKSTFFKQIKILFMNGFTATELNSYRNLIRETALRSIQKLISAASTLHLKVSSRIKEDCKNIMKITDLKEEHGSIIKRVWQDKGIQAAWSRANEFQIDECANYYMNDIQRIVATDYVPTITDILYVRQKTTGVSELTFKLDDTEWTLIDVGGQRTERRKWLHCFQDVIAIIYFVALNEYDMKLLEDERVNRMQESLELFKEVASSRWFRNTLCILLFSKTDLLMRKIQHCPLSNFFPDYGGGSDFQAALKFIQEKFLRLYSGSSLQAYTLCTLDTENVKNVFQEMKPIIERRVQNVVL
jgi:guanine nucleotide-binding protein G(i) subunit alpha